MRVRLIAASVLLVLPVMGCDEPPMNGDEANDTSTDEANDTSTDESGETTDESGESTDESGESTDESGETGGEECLPVEQGQAPNFDVQLFGFSEVSGNMLNAELHHSGPCVLDTMDFEANLLTMELSCEHASPSLPEGASVLITTVASGLPAGVAVGDTLTFDAEAWESQGGIEVDPDVSLLIFEGNVQNYELYDENGPVFAADLEGLGGNYAPVLVEGFASCPDWQGCSGEFPDTTGYIRATAADQSIEVHVGEVGVLDTGAMSWDITLFSAIFDSDDCHFGISGHHSVVRRP